MGDPRYQKAIQELKDVGCAVIEGFLDDSEVEELKSACRKIVSEFSPEKDPISLFSTYDEKHSERDRYFMESSDKIRYFFEEKAITDQGKLAFDVKDAVNKIGHGLHLLDPTFKKVSFSPKVQQLAHSMGYEDPAIVQSMYIFKQPGIGGEVTPHQDATFLNCDPIGSLTGLWFALEDATLENGCLHFIPNSHKTIPLTKRFVRNSEPGGPLMKMIGSQPTFEDSQFVPAPVRKGSLVLIHGLVVHRSSGNHSSKSRHAYTFHIIERHNTVWNKENCIRKEDGNLVALYLRFRGLKPKRTGLLGRLRKEKSALPHPGGLLKNAEFLEWTFTPTSLKLILSIKEEATAAASTSACNKTSLGCELFSYEIQEFPCPVIVEHSTFEVKESRNGSFLCLNLRKTEPSVSWSDHQRRNGTLDNAKNDPS